MTGPPGRRRRQLGFLAAAVVGLAGIANIPVTTKQGMNFEVTAHKIPLYVKSFEFLDRSAQYGQIAREIARDAATDSDRALAIFEWTRRRIKATPEGWPVVDDHVLNIIVRGHGLGDQQADVFVTLTTYAGVPAFWSHVPADRSRPNVLLSFALVGGRWRVFDVAGGIVFRTGSGDLATLEDLAGHAELVPADVKDLQVEGRSYGDIVSHAATPSIPHPLRAELQMPVPRLWHEMKSAAGFEHTDESDR